jgi:soluble lytic murein transglycosylase-like protein
LAAPAAPARCGIVAPVPIDGEVHQNKARPARSADRAQYLANRRNAGSLIVRVAALVAVALALTPASATAQIYAWRDASGTLVLSDRELNTPTKIYEVPGAPSYRTTTAADHRPAASPRFDDIVVAHAQRHALRPELVRAVIQVESGYNPTATSAKGAMGLMQLMPATARELGVRNAYDPEENIRGGTAYLRQLLDRYAGNEELALAAYNAGSGAVDRYGQRVPPFRETRDYVRKVGLKAGTETGSRTKVVIYKSIEIIDGRAIPRYSTQRPAAGTFEIIRR